MTAAAKPAVVFDAMAERDLLVISGKGGVGRTTVAALLGLAIAKRGRRVLVATTGCDDRLAWMLGVSALHEAPEEVADHLAIVRLDPQVCTREYGAMMLRSQRLSSAVFDNRIVRRLLRAIPGLDDFAVLGKAWHEATRADNYDCVILDGAATGHLRYMLGVPQAILSTVPEGPLTKEAALMQEALEDPACSQAVLVGIPDAWPLTEIGELGAALHEDLRMAVDTVFVNGMWPSDLPDLDATAVHDERVSEVFQNVGHVAHVGRRHSETVAAWLEGAAAQRCGLQSLVRVPWRWGGLSDVEDVRRLLAALESQVVSG